MLLLIDNYDSFTYNLVHLVGMVARSVHPGLEVKVVRNDQIDGDAALALDPTHCIVSPGPCTPKEAGNSPQILDALSAAGVPTLGVCLGHQCIADLHGGIVERAGRLMHGKTDQIYHDGVGLFQGVPSPFTATRYHSLLVRRGSLDEDNFRVTAWTDQDEIMALEHRHRPLLGLQFHPESFLTEHGDKLIENFLKLNSPRQTSVEPTSVS